MRHFSKLTKIHDIALKSVSSDFPLDAVKLFLVSSFSVKKTTLKYIYLKEHVLHLPLSDKTLYLSLSGLEDMLIKNLNEKLKQSQYIKEIRWY